MFDTKKLLVDVFAPEAGETVLVMHDLPRPGVPDNDEWRERREMAADWHRALAELSGERGFRLLPVLTFESTGANNADLPAEASLEGKNVALETVLDEATLAIAMTEFSATAPLAVFAEDRRDFRAASMPGVLRRMERSALAADYAEVARHCRAIFDVLLGAESGEVVFSTGHRCTFDLRHREPEMDDGSLPRFKEGDRIINLPSGETYIVPYEGEREDEPSFTSGTIPVDENGEVVLFHVAANRIVAVEGEGAGAERYRDFFEEDPARANVAELAFGVNDKAVVTGIVLEDEKAGFHWAFGRSDHLGGVVGVDRFRSPATVVHQDIVYARDNRIQVVRAAIRQPDGGLTDVIRDGEYVV